MSNYNKDSLFSLIKSLNRSEKRQFKVYVNRLQINADAKFLLLFDTLDKLEEYDETVILKKKITTKQQLSNLKAHLYKQILISLRMSPSQQNNRMQIREQFDFATILYQKGLYKQSLKILDKAKFQAYELEEKAIAYDILELEKIIESQFITRSISGRADQLIEESEELSLQNLQTNRLSNLSLKLYSLLLENGYAKNEEEINKIKNLFIEQTKDINLNDLKFKEKLWFYKANVWLAMLIQDSDYAFEYSKKWVELFYEKKERIQQHPVWFLKGHTYLLKILYLKKNSEEFKFWYDQLEKSSAYFPSTDNVEALWFITKFNSKLNYFFINPKENISPFLIKDILREIKLHQRKIDNHHILILYLKIAAYHFLNKDWENSFEYCQKIVNSDFYIQEDLHFYTYVLIMMNLYDSGNDLELDSYSYKTHQFCKKMKNNNSITRKISLFFIELNDLYPQEKIKAFRDLDKFLIEAESDELLRRNTNYINLRRWIKDKI
ncbi:hypothetical protein [Chishuiella sp.]|uniref:hypothetical protein n=1 Tax=Chishuiella sp. TaxID=1969467 RepID=UPI0028ACD54C|nr:hypothetical protein [Chishuiella sp.]